MIFASKNILKKLGLDKAVLLTVLSRIIQATGGIISIVFIAKFLSPNEQGYYYTFASILAIQIFFELGLSGIITQYTAHEFAHLKWNGFNIEGETYNKSRLSSLLHFCIKWFAIISVLVFFVLVIVGFYFFQKFNVNTNITWKGPWIILCLSTALNLFIDPILAYFDGLGHVKDMAKVRLIQKTINIVLLFFFLGFGFKLYSSALASLIAILFNYFQVVFSNRIIFLKVIWREKSEWIIDYYKEIFPFQWKIALSWISGYFIFQLFNPVLFATEGPVVAGQMGMTIAALTGIASISMSWITTKIPSYSALIAKNEFIELDLVFNKTFKNSILINAICLLLLVVTVFIAKSLNLTIGKRFLAWLPFICMCIASFANQIIFALATYLRCHKKEPMLVQSIVIAILIALSTFCLGYSFGVVGICIGYSGLTIIAVIWTCQIFITKKREWHHE